MLDDILVQLVSDGATAQLERDWCSCAAPCHHVSDNSLSLTLPTWPTDTANQSRIAITDYCLFLYAVHDTGMTGCVSDLWQRTNWGHWCRRTYTVCWTTATLY